MSRKAKRDAVDAAALSMGGGVGLATLEAMFNMVNTQSLVSAAMVRDHDMAQPLQIQAQAAALAKILNTDGSAPVAVDIARPDPAAGAAGGDDGFEMGAVSGLSELKDKMNTTTNMTIGGAEATARMLLQEKRLTALETKMDGVIAASAHKQPDWW